MGMGYWDLKFKCEAAVRAGRYTETELESYQQCDSGIVHSYIKEYVEMRHNEHRKHMYAMVYMLTTMHTYTHRVINSRDTTSHQK